MLLMIALSFAMNCINMGIQVGFYSVAAYCVAKYAHKGWKAGA